MNLFWKKASTGRFSGWVPLGVLLTGLLFTAAVTPTVASPMLVALLGAFLSFVLYSFINAEIKARKSAEAYAHKLKVSEENLAAQRDKLRESVELYRAISDIAADGIITMDSQSVIVSANQSAEQIFGYGPGELVGRSLSDLIPPRFRAGHFAGIRRFLESNSETIQRKGIELPGLHQSGRELALDLSFGLSVLNNRRLFTAVIRDVTERKRAEEAPLFLAECGKVLSQSLHYETTLANVARLAVPKIADWCAIDMLDEKGQLERLVLIHSDPAKIEAAEQLRRKFPPPQHSPHGVARVIRNGQSELYGEIDEELLKRAGAGPEQVALLQQLGLRSAVIVPIKARGKAFGAITFVAESTRTYGPADLALAEEVALLAGFAIDNALLFRAAERELAEREQAEAALVESERRFRLFIEQARDYAIIMLDTSGRISSWNTGAERILGYSETEIVGQPGALLFTQEDQAAGIPQNEISTALNEGQANDERWHVRKDGTRFWASGYLFALRDHSEKLRGFAKIMRDITERKKTEESIRQLNQELERRVRERTSDLQESHEQMEAFTYTVAHDLRAPLRSMHGLSQALIEDYEPQLDAQARDYLDRIILAAKRMDALIQDLLAYSRLTRSDLKFTSVSLETVVENAMALLAEEQAQRQAEIQVTRPLPLVIGHQGTLEHMAANLISNAMKFVAPSIRPHVKIGAEQKNHRVRLWVHDNGIGIAPQHQERIFRIFERLHPVDAYPGTGIGLAIVRKGAERMGGSFGLESAVGQGSRFWIELPCPHHE